MKEKNKILIVIPAFNEEHMIGKVLTDIKTYKNNIGKFSVVVIDDGSSDNTEIVAKQYGVKVLRHVINRGLGAALSTGFAYARSKNASIIVTFDADGQHRAKDIARLVKPIKKNDADIVIGTRLRQANSMPVSRKIINWLSNVATFILFGIWTTDSQSGFRAFSKRAIGVITLRAQRMEVSSEIFKEIRRNKLRYVEIPIPAIYTQYSLNKGQKLANASMVVWKLLLRQIR